MSASSEAAAAQLSGGYSVDLWMEIKLPAMMKLWQGIGGSSNFFVSENDARFSMGSYEGSDPYTFAETLWRFAQVSANPSLGYRQGIREFVVDIDCEAAIGVCFSNADKGTGGVVQYYIPNWERSLMPTGRDYKFAKKGY